MKTKTESTYLLMKYSKVPQSNNPRRCLVCMYFFQVNKIVAIQNYSQGLTLLMRVDEQAIVS